MNSHGRKVKDHPEVSVIDLVYHLADYWKHSDDWPNWNAGGKHKYTVLILKSVGIDNNTEYPCVRVMQMITPSVENLFDILLEVLGSWRESVVEYHLAEGFFERQGGNPQQHGEV